MPGYTNIFSQDLNKDAIHDDRWGFKYLEVGEKSALPQHQRFDKLIREIRRGNFRPYLDRWSKESKRPYEQIINDKIFIFAHFLHAENTINACASNLYTVGENFIKESLVSSLLSSDHINWLAPYVSDTNETIIKYHHVMVNSRLDMQSLTGKDQSVPLPLPGYLHIIVDLTQEELVIESIQASNQLFANLMKPKDIKQNVTGKIDGVCIEHLKTAANIERAALQTKLSLAVEKVSTTDNHREISQSLIDLRTLIRFLTQLGLTDFLDKHATFAESLLNIEQCFRKYNLTCRDQSRSYFDYFKLHYLNGLLKTNDVQQVNDFLLNMLCALAYTLINKVELMQQQAIFLHKLFQQISEDDGTYPTCYVDYLKNLLKTTEAEKNNLSVVEQYHKAHEYLGILNLWQYMAKDYAALGLNISNVLTVRCVDQIGEYKALLLALNQLKEYKNRILQDIIVHSDISEDTIVNCIDKYIDLDIFTDKEDIKRFLQRAAFIFLHKHLRSELSRANAEATNKDCTVQLVMEKLKSSRALNIDTATLQLAQYYQQVWPYLSFILAANKLSKRIDMANVSADLKQQARHVLFNTEIIAKNYPKEIQLMRKTVVFVDNVLDLLGRNVTMSKEQIKDCQALIKKVPGSASVGLSFVGGLLIFLGAAMLVSSVCCGLLGFGMLAPISVVGISLANHLFFAGAACLAFATMAFGGIALAFNQKEGLSKRLHTFLGAAKNGFIIDSAGAVDNTTSNPFVNATATAMDEAAGLSETTDNQTSAQQIKKETKQAKQIKLFPFHCALQEKQTSSEKGEQPAPVAYRPMSPTVAG